jgi:hypothetical protein
MKGKRLRLSAALLACLALAGCALNGFGVDRVRLAFDLPADSALIGRSITALDSYSEGWITPRAATAVIGTRTELAFEGGAEPWGGLGEVSSGALYSFYVRVGGAGPAGYTETKIDVDLPAPGRRTRGLARSMPVTIATEAGDIPATATVEYFFGAWY